MVLALEMFSICRMRLQVYILWIFVAVTMPKSSVAMFVGDSCTMKSHSGVCKLASQCPELEMAVRAGTFSTRDIVNCGFATHEEIICCPTGDGVVTENRSDDKYIFEHSPTSTTFSTITTSTTTTEASNTDFWVHLLTTTLKPPIEAEETTTTAKPDFWLYLLNSTTTTTTTTPKPLIINGQVVDPNARFIDLTAMLSENSPQDENDDRRSVRDNQFETAQANSNQPTQIPTSINDRTFGWQNPPMGIPNPTVEWSIPRPRQISQNGMPLFVPNPGMPFRNGPRHHQHPRAEWPAGPSNMGGNAFFPQQFPAPMMQQGFPNPMGNVRSNNVMQPLRFPTDEGERTIQQSGPDRSFGNNWDLPQEMKFNAPPQNEWTLNNNNNGRQQWQENNDFSQPNPRSNNIWPNRELQNAAVRNPTNAGLPRTPSNPFLNEHISSLSKIKKPTFSSKDEKDPIEMVNQNLIKSGIEIINAKLEKVQRGDNEFNGENTIETTTRRPKTTDPFVPFQFRPQPDENFNENAENFDQKPVWGVAKSSSTTSSTTIAPKTTVNPRTTDRPAVVACQEIDKGLVPGLSQHILSGTPVEIGEFPHMAAIGYSSIGNEEGPYDYRCGGTLIAKRFVLTAAHCVNSRDSQPSVVLLGLVDIMDTDQRNVAEEIPVRQVHIHPDYSNSRTYNDVAILELQRDVKYSDYIYPTCLYTDRDDPPKSSILYVTGWGQINTATRQKSNILLKAKLEIVPVSQCNESYVEMGLNRRINQGVQTTQMCAHDPGLERDACQGDSGGPLNMVVDESMKKYRIVGVISAGFSCGSATPGLYARVAAYLDFIESIVWPNLI